MWMHNGMIQDLRERDSNEKNARTWFTTSERLASDLHNLEHEWHDMLPQEDRQLV
jgi:hypothetical protein